MTATNENTPKKLLVINVIPGDWYLSADGQMWKHYDDMEEGCDALVWQDPCYVCGEKIYCPPDFSGRHIGDDEKAHWECVEVKTAAEIFGGYNENLRPDDAVVMGCDKDGRPTANFRVGVDIEYLNDQYKWLLDVAETFKVQFSDSLPEPLIGLLNLLEGMREMFITDMEGGESDE